MNILNVWRTFKSFVRWSQLISSFIRPEQTKTFLFFASKSISTHMKCVVMHILTSLVVQISFVLPHSLVRQDLERQTRFS